MVKGLVVERTPVVHEQARNIFHSFVSEEDDTPLSGLVFTSLRLYPSHLKTRLNARVYNQ